MLLDLSTADAFAGKGPSLRLTKTQWGVDSEYGRLTDVMLAPPAGLEIVPCNAAARDALGMGLICDPETAMRQHRALARALRNEGVRCHFAPAARAMPDLCFTRDTGLMTPWGLLALSPSAAHRRAEVDHVVAAARSWGVPLLGRLDEGRVEGGDVCIVRPGLVLIGCSGDRTDEAGAAALARLFKSRGWQAVVTRFDPRYLHLDTLFSIVDERLALSCTDALEAGFATQLEGFGFEIVPATGEEVERLGCNLLSLGDGRVVSSADNGRVNLALADRGYRVIALDIDQFTRCGGGAHCLTMPLARLPG